MSSYERVIATKQPQHVAPSVHGWLLNRSDHQLLLCPPVTCRCTCFLSPTLSCSCVTLSQAVSWVDGCSSGRSAAWLPPWLWGGWGRHKVFVFSPSVPQAMEWSVTDFPSTRYLGSPPSWYHPQPTQSYLAGSGQSGWGLH